MNTTTRHIAIFASGNGSNAINIIRYLQKKRQDASFTVLSNKPEAPVLEKARQLQVETLVFNRQDFYHEQTVLNYLQASGTQLIVLAGFLWLVPAAIVRAFAGKIVNIHPSLLPRYGGRGMYGMKVHQAVIDAGEQESGITIHYIDEHYDRGEIILQKSCPVNVEDTAESLAWRIHQLEHKHYPEVVEELITRKQ